MVSWQAFPSLPPRAPRPSRFSLALNSTSLLFQTPATQAIEQSWNVDPYIGGETSKLINFSQCKTNSELDFRLKKDKVSTVFKKPNWNARWRNIARHIYKAANLSAKWHALKIALVAWFSLFLFLKHWPKLLQCSTIVAFALLAFAAPWYLHEKSLVIHW